MEQLHGSLGTRWPDDSYRGAKRGWRADEAWPGLGQAPARGSRHFAARCSRGSIGLVI